MKYNTDKSTLGEDKMNKRMKEKPMNKKGNKVKSMMAQKMNGTRDNPPTKNVSYVNPKE